MRCTRHRGAPARADVGGDLSYLGPYILAFRKWGRKRSRAAGGHGAR
jgi:hypothetical protein